MSEPVREVIPERIMEQLKFHNRRERDLLDLLVRARDIIERYQHYGVLKYMAAMNLNEEARTWLEDCPPYILD